MKTTVKTKKGIQGKIEGGDNGECIKGGKPWVVNRFKAQMELLDLKF